MARIVGDKNKSPKHSQAAVDRERSAAWAMTKNIIDHGKTKKRAEEKYYNSQCGPISISYKTVTKITVRYLNPNIVTTLN